MARMQRVGPHRYVDIHLWDEWRGKYDELNVSCCRPAVECARCVAAGGHGHLLQCASQTGDVSETIRVRVSGVGHRMRIGLCADTSIGRVDDLIFTQL
jgi:hypothetical protein